MLFNFWKKLNFIIKYNKKRRRLWRKNIHNQYFFILSTPFICDMALKFLYDLDKFFNLNLYFLYIKLFKSIFSNKNNLVFIGKSNPVIVENNLWTKR